MSTSAVAAGLIAVIVSYAGPMAIVFQAADAGSIGEVRLESWVWAISIGSGVTCVALSWAYRAPVLTAWSTPGAALLVSGLATYSYGEAVGAYLLAALATVLVGATGLFGTVMRLLPQPVAAAMLAGILLSFGIDVFRAADTSPGLIALMLAGYVLARRLAPRWATAWTLLLGCLYTAVAGDADFSAVELSLAGPELTAPSFSPDAAIGLALPLFLVTMASQNAPGIAVLRSAGYDASPDRLVVTTGVASAVLAPAGAHAINLAAITAAICTGREAHEDPRRRYVAGITCGVGYVLVGVFGTALVALFTALPVELVAAVAGIALLGAIGASLASATAEERHRDSALVAFLVTASGVEWWGIGSAFWGLTLGLAVHLLTTYRRATP
ncbi:benzoate/H(+) symporter BenE family transporter [Streptomyces profundus]|uniref:benzoate/H(+) symporter BenE family transporter n=1 Tax=Streptomyces profundus TaxID=2867410 RepID=UPI001D163D7F|nr:benzoate/H(+) symporter BenE family transporter [Streptomyces sp. MA3_2.13]UED85452.1 benzoate/H(+) symporter BenE family transporter [Streptomyces sp. MA3_2.13]